jgi:hypothetical protein
MSVNRDLPHVLVLPEDDANRQLANGFHKEVPWNRQRRMQVLEVARGWTRVLGLFGSVHVPEMHRCPTRFMVLLIDFDDQQPERLRQAQNSIPQPLTERVFILGARSEPEALKPVLGLSYEEIGSKLARDCREEADDTWGHALLQHNAEEVRRLRERVSPILFPSEAVLGKP